ncbi:MAG: 4Fe-4S binding protein [Candidatus Cloacimonetes bacterium]|nr:4Fe-4S binding protein [Candidatus Cloacimonadota bacterium]
MKNKEYYHALRFELENCTGCTKCVRVCPTEALRVRNGKVLIDNRRCIDCGNCLRACQYNAIQAVADDLDRIAGFKYRLAVLSAAYAGQFSENIGYRTAKKAILQIGFDEVAEEAMVTGMMSRIIREYIREHADQKPILSSNCPAVVRLIQVRFPSLLPSLLHVEAPMSVLAAYFREKIAREKNLGEEEIGIFLVVPCISQVTAVHQPEGAYRHLQDGAIAIQSVYREAIGKIKQAERDERQVDIYPRGLSWAISGMQAEEINNGEIKTLAVNGIDNVIEILSKIENHQIEKYDYVVLSNCLNGCIGGILNNENPFIATSRIRDLIRSAQHIDFHDDHFYEMFKQGKFDVLALEARPILTLAPDIKDALIKLKEIEELTRKLPGLDCSACGSPTCRALAEDIVEGKASFNDCMVLSRKKRGTQEK